LSNRWYVLDAREAKWYDRGPRVAYARFERPTPTSFREEFLP